MDGQGPDHLRVALVGYGVAGSTFHAPLIEATPELRLSAIVTANLERQAAVRRAHPGAEVIERAEQLWERAEAFDLAVIASPNRTHAPLALDALAAGLAVVVDKPFASTADLARQVATDAARRGLMVTVFQNRRWDNDFLTLRRLMADDTLGRVLRFESRFERWRPTLKQGWRERGAPEEAGGVLFDLGSHLIDQALQLFGPVTDVYAELDRRRPGVEVDDDSFLALMHASGTHSHLWMSAVAAQLGPRLRALGERGAYTKYGLDPQEKALAAGGDPGRPGWGLEAPEMWGRVGTEGDLHEVPSEAGCYQRFYAEVVKALREGTPPPVDPNDAITVLQIIETARSVTRKRYAGGV
jgi:predicted dehydrogenase